MPLYPNAGRQFAWQPDFAGNLGIWKEQGWDSLRVMRDYTRKRKWEFHVYIRMEAFKAPFPFDVQENSKFFIRASHWVIVGKIPFQGSIV